MLKNKTFKLIFEKNIKIFHFCQNCLPKMAYERVSNGKPL